MRLTLEPGRFAICRLPEDSPLADWMWSGGLASVTRRAGERSVVCDEAAVPDSVKAHAGWRALTVAGPLDFSLTGVLASLAAPLADAGVPIFVLSTFDTDVLLVQDRELAKAVETLAAAGHEVA